MTLICRMESTEKCEVVIQHFNGKYLKTPPGIPGESHLLCFSLLPSDSFHVFIGKIITFAIRNHLSNSIMVISHLRCAGLPDRLCTLWCLTTEANCHGFGWIANYSVGLFFSATLSPYATIFSPPWWCSCCRLELLGQEKTLLIFTLMPPCCSLQST